MVGMLMEALIRYSEKVSADARILAALESSIDYLWTNEWDATSRGSNTYRWRAARAVTATSPSRA